VPQEPGSALETRTSAIASTPISAFSQSEGPGAHAPGPLGNSAASLLAIDGSRISVAGAVDLPARGTSQASFALPKSWRSHPFRSHRPGYSYDLEAWVVDPDARVEVGARLELPLREGRLRVAAVRQPSAVGVRDLVFGAWEHADGCIVTSRRGTDVHALAALLATLPFRAHADGCTLALPLDNRIRPPTVMLHAPNLGVLFIRPHTRQLLERLPRSAGARTEGGELFRVRATRQSLLLVTRSAIVDIEPVSAVSDAVVAAQSLRVEWAVASE
jgi:hypothetical protein